LIANVGFMRVLRKSGSYVRNQAWKNIGLATLCLLVLGVAFLPAVPKLVYLQIGLLEELQLVVSLAALIGFFICMRRYRIFHSGLEGEQQVTKVLKARLSDDYFLINDAYFRDGGGDIDHIILGPNGLFAVETKNWSGKVTCQGDNWQRDKNHKNTNNANPSKQAKRNASRIKNLIESAPFGAGNVWVEGIVVFTNRNINLNVTHPAIPVLKVHELPAFITAHNSRVRYSRQQLEQIGKEILKQTQ
jgi:hypothetical protein